MTFKPPWAIGIQEATKAVRNSLLSTRAKNIILMEILYGRKKPKTVGELRLLSQADWLRIKNCGRKTLTEIENWLRSYPE